MTQTSQDDAPIDVERAAVDATYRRLVLKRLAAPSPPPSQPSQAEATASAGPSERG